MLSGPDIFISYSREDSTMARTYRDAFEREGFEVWWDQALRSGETYDEVTEAALRSAKAVVVLWSPRSVASRWVRAEAVIADRNKAFVPVMIETCDRPVMFELTQTADLCHWKGDEHDVGWRALVDGIRRRAGESEGIEADARPAPRKSDARSEIPVVAVLPFSHRAGDEEMEILAEDLFEEVTRELAQYSYFSVTASVRMRHWRGKEIDYPALKREVDARYLLEGKLQRVNDNVRLTVDVIDAATGDIMMSPRFSSSLADITETPEAFPATISSQMGEHIIQTELNRATTKQGPLSGWEHMLRAHAYPTRLTSDNLRDAVEEARKAVEASPNLGLAHAMLAGLLGVLTTYGLEQLDDALRREIQTHVKRAMQLDGDNAALLTSLVNAYAILGDEEASLRLAWRAADLAPNSAQAQFALGRACVTMGQTTDAIAAFRKQLRLAPQNYARVVALQFIGFCCSIEGNPVEGEVALDEALALHPDFGGALRWKAVVQAQQNNEDAALASIMQLRRVEPDMSLDQHLRSVTAYPRMHERAAEVIATLRRLWAATEAKA